MKANRWQGEQIYLYRPIVDMHKGARGLSAVIELEMDRQPTDRCLYVFCSRGEVLSAQQSIRFFQQHNDCPRTSSTKRLPDSDTGDGTRVARQIYSNCKEATELKLLRVIGGGYTWPGGDQYLRARRVGVVSRDINASELILNFFLKQAR